MLTAIVEERRRALKHRNAVLRRCRIWFPSEEIDLPDLHNDEVICDLRVNDEAKYDSMIHDALSSALLH